MGTFLRFFDQLIAILKPAFFWLAVVFAIVFALDWAVRTRKISPLGRIGQFMRRYVDPLIAPVERRIVRAGGMPAAAPWWALVAVVVGGIVILWGLDTIRLYMAEFTSGASGGFGSLVAVLINWTFGILQLAILLRVLSSWVGLSTYSPWLRWTVTLSEPILRPLRQIIPTIGFIDITPIVAFFLLRFTQAIVMSMLG